MNICVVLPNCNNTMTLCLPFNLTIKHKWVLVLTPFALPPHPRFLTLLALFPTSPCPLTDYCFLHHSTQEVLLYSDIFFALFVFETFGARFTIYEVLYSGFQRACRGTYLYPTSKPEGPGGQYLPQKSIAVGGSQDAICGTILYIKNWVGVTLLCYWPLSIFDGEEWQLVNNGGRKWLRWKVKDRARLQYRNRSVLIIHQVSFWLFK